ncbi:hypothetical protein AYO38_00120 [bacterium SCGC AG-212-C10]|nr:hypothetical protein AYO38_00120 [bacterium SCGC AG-212-C10]
MADLRDLDGVHNFRAVAPYPLRGGGTIRANSIYRSGALELMTEADYAWLANDIGIRRVMDLRHPDEFGEGVKHQLAELVCPLSIFPETGTQQSIIAELNGLYGNGPSPERYLHYLQAGSHRFVESFQVLAEAETYPVLIHCTAGKDRTGVVVGMLMDILGASDEDIADEYGLSDASIERLISYLESTGRVLEGTREEIRDRLSTPPDRMAGFIILLRKKYGSAEEYLLSHGLPTSAVDRIRTLLTVSAA